MKNSLVWLVVTVVLLGLAWVIPPHLGFFLGIAVLVRTADPKRGLIVPLFRYA